MNLDDLMNGDDLRADGGKQHSKPAAESTPTETKVNEVVEPTPASQAELSPQAVTPTQTETTSQPVTPTQTETAQPPAVDQVAVSNQPVSPETAAEPEAVAEVASAPESVSTPEPTVVPEPVVAPEATAAVEAEPAVDEQSSPTLLSQAAQLIEASANAIKSTAEAVVAPVSEAPAAEVPAAEVPAAEAPASESAVVEAPVSETGSHEAPAAAATTPGDEARTTETSETSGPIAELGATETSATEMSVTGGVAAKPKKKKKKSAEANDSVAAAASESTESSKSTGFDALGLSGPVAESLREGDYINPTSIQAAIIPHLLGGRDVVAQSETGSGKTAGFALPILSRLRSGGGKAGGGGKKRSSGGRAPSVLVLAPTRELAIQVVKSFQRYASHMDDVQVLGIVGGQDYEPQLRALNRGVDIVVATPGRVIDHIRRGSLDPSRVQTLVLDEADEMLKMGFLEDVEFVLGKISSERQVALFSATMPPPIRKIAETYLNDPAMVTIRGETMTADSIVQRALFVPPKQRVDMLTRILEADEADGVIVFTKTKDSTLFVAEQLSRRGFKAVALNGDMPQSVRERTVASLKNSHIDILVATDVAARGLDVPRISHVVNFDMPHDSESYVHRVGRTGRAGRSGVAYLFLTRGQRHQLRTIERMTRGTIDIVDPPTADVINKARIESFKANLRRVIAAEDLTLYKDLITSYVEESGQPIELVAAGMARLAQGDEAFFVKDMPAPSKRDRDRDDSRGGDRYDRSERGPRGERGERGERPERGRRDRNAPPVKGRRRYRIAVGRNDGLYPKHIVGAIANEANLEGREIGPIQIFDQFATVDLPDSVPNHMIEQLGDTRIVGRPMRLREWVDNPGSEKRGGGGGYRGGGGGGGGGRSGGGGGRPGGKFGGPKFGGGKVHSGKPRTGGKPRSGGKPAFGKGGRQEGSRQEGSRSQSGEGGGGGYRPGGGIGKFKKGKPGRDRD